MSYPEVNKRYNQKHHEMLDAPLEARTDREKKEKQKTQRST